MNRAIASALLALPLAAGALAQEPVIHPDLPPLSEVERVLSRHPQVRAARDTVRFEQANDRRLRAGPYEFALRGGYQNHSIANGQFPEWDIGVERAIRLPNKARVDNAIGAQGVELARRAAYSAWCDGARQLLKLWFGWARE
ncbi:MAG: transporter, partial [Casimicrobiaceae bacterium]